jgi:hypothetical protein
MIRKPEAEEVWKNNIEAGGRRGGRESPKASERALRRRTHPIHPPDSNIPPTGNMSHSAMMVTPTMLLHTVIGDDGETPRSCTRWTRRRAGVWGVARPLAL